MDAGLGLAMRLVVNTITMKAIGHSGEALVVTQAHELYYTNPLALLPDGVLGILITSNQLLS